MTRWILHESWIAALELVLVASIAFSLAHWTWALFGPRALGAPAPAVLPEPERAASAATRHLLGVADGAAASGTTVRSDGALSLVGVFAGPSADTGRALIAPHGGKPALVAAGEPVGDGVVLHEVHADHVIVLRDGAPERVDLQRRVAPPAPLAPSSAPVRK